MQGYACFRAKFSVKASTFQIDWKMWNGILVDDYSFQCYKSWNDHNLGYYIISGYLEKYQLNEPHIYYVLKTIFGHIWNCCIDYNVFSVRNIFFWMVSSRITLIPSIFIVRKRKISGNSENGKYCHNNKKSVSLCHQSLTSRHDMKSQK